MYENVIFTAEYEVSPDEGICHVVLLSLNLFQTVQTVVNDFILLLFILLYKIWYCCCSQRIETLSPFLPSCFRFCQLISAWPLNNELLQNCRRFVHQQLGLSLSLNV